MKLKFKIQPFQNAAVATVLDLFRGQEKRSSTFTISLEDQMKPDRQRALKWRLELSALQQ